MNEGLPTGAALQVRHSPVRPSTAVPLLAAPVVEEDITDKSVANLEWVTHRRKSTIANPATSVSSEHPRVLVAPLSDLKKMFESSEE